MNQTIHHHCFNRSRIHFTVICIAYFFALCSCSGEGESKHRKLLRGIPDEMIEHVLSSDDSTLVRYGRNAGYVVLADACRVLDHRMYNLFSEERTEDALTLLNYIKRIAGVLASELNYSLYLDRLVFWENLPSDVRRRLIDLELEYYSFRARLETSPSEKLEKYSTLLEIFKRYDDVLFIALCEYELSYAYKTLGDEDKRISHLRSAAAGFAKCGLHEMTSPTLGELGEYYGTIGDIDSMVICFEEAKRISTNAQLPMEAAQVLNLYAEHYYQQGRLSLAHDLLINSMEIARKYKGEYTELRSIVETMNFQADLGCWEIVERLLRRARVLQSKYEEDAGKYFTLFSLQINLIDGRLAMANGNVDKAHLVFAETEKAIAELDMPYTREPETARLRLFWSLGLIENDLVQAALDIARQGLRVCKDADLGESSARFALLIARISLRMNDLAAAKSSIAQFDSLAHATERGLEREWIERDVLNGQLNLETGKRSSAERALESGWSRLRESVSKKDASVQSYLWIGECEFLRQLAHDLAKQDPVMGYGVELLWRDFYRLLGENDSHSVPTDPRTEPPPSQGTEIAAPENRMKLSDFTTRARAAQRRLEDLDAIHSVYVIRGDQIWRWTLSGESIRSEPLDTPTEVVRKRVNETWKMMAPGRAGSQVSPTPELASNLRWLAKTLLPPEALALPGEDAKTPFFVTADRFLNRVPFEAFDIGGNDDYIPLLLARDVAYLRRVPSSNRGANSNPGVILVNNTPSAELKTRYPFQRELTEAMSEAETVLELKPRARLLHGKEATKPILKSLWQDASFVYLATHTLRDPQVPYLRLIPLTVTGMPSAPDAAYLDVTDIRGADFSRCHAVILSGCSSGAAYVGTGNTGPSLGDAFLDSGAAAVVQTIWDVRDDYAKGMMTEFMQSWNDPGGSVISALCGARRRVFRNAPGIEGISRWAPFLVETGEI